MLQVILVNSSHNNTAYEFRIVLKCRLVLDTFIVFYIKLSRKTLIITYYVLVYDFLNTLEIEGSPNSHAIINVINIHSCWNFI